MSEDTVVFFPERKLCFNYMSRFAGMNSAGCSGCQFSHGGTNVYEICRRMLEAKKSIDLCINVSTYKPIIDVLERAHKNGIIVRIITCFKKDDPYDKIGYLQSKGIHVKRNKEFFMHHKFIIIDSKIVIHGSANHSVRAFNHNNETIKFENDPTIVNRFKKEFDKLWLNFTETPIERQVENRRRSYSFPGPIGLE